MKPRCQIKLDNITYPSLVKNPEIHSRRSRLDVTAILNAKKSRRFLKVQDGFPTCVHQKERESECLSLRQKGQNNLLSGG